MPEYTYQQEFRRCGKANCSRCPHGPYWYAYWRVGEKIKKRYIGKKLTPETAPDAVPDHTGNLRPRMTSHRACQILRVANNWGYNHVHQCWQWHRRAALARVPVDPREIVEIDEAWHVLMEKNAW